MWMIERSDSGRRTFYAEEAAGGIIEALVSEAIGKSACIAPKLL
jgi:hypothetical protein